MLVVKGCNVTFVSSLSSLHCITFVYHGVVCASVTITLGVDCHSVRVATRLKRLIDPVSLATCASQSDGIKYHVA